MWDVPQSGIKTVSPALAGRFFTTEPAGQTPIVLLSKRPKIPKKRENEGEKSF